MDGVYIHYNPNKATVKPEQGVKSCPRDLFNSPPSSLTSRQQISPPLSVVERSKDVTLAIDRTYEIGVRNQMLIGVVCLGALASARPRFLAIPLDDVEVVEVADYAEPGRYRREAPGGQEGWEVIEMVPQTRFARQIKDADLEVQEEGGRFQRGAHGGGGGGGGDGHDYVDYGAHTGHHGAFGWYADFPVHKGH
uniref:Uncharacterized protein n=1 Tax=Timema bartmani TaxID=61472 RepID=A0A7R9F4Y5_9NEOP|nr:unnamed protein product [Timema bartmani]